MRRAFVLVATLLWADPASARCSLLCPAMPLVFPSGGTTVPMNTHVWVVNAPNESIHVELAHAGSRLTIAMSRTEHRFGDTVVSELTPSADLAAAATWEVRIAGKSPAIATFRTSAEHRTQPPGWSGLETATLPGLLHDECTPSAGEASWKPAEDLEQFPAFPDSDHDWRVSLVAVWIAKVDEQVDLARPMFITIADTRLLLGGERACPHRLPFSRGDRLVVRPVDITGLLGRASEIVPGSVELDENVPWRHAAKARWVEAP